MLIIQIKLIYKFNTRISTQFSLLKKTKKKIKKKKLFAHRAILFILKFTTRHIFLLSIRIALRLDIYELVYREKNF